MNEKGKKIKLPTGMCERLNVCGPLGTVQIPMLNPNRGGDVMWRWGLWEVTRSQGQSLHDGIGRGPRELSLPFRQVRTKQDCPL